MNWELEQLEKLFWCLAKLVLAGVNLLIVVWGEKVKLSMLSWVNFI